MCYNRRETVVKFQETITMAKKGRMVFGPVPSRRLGFSLGVDLVPFKTCPLDCVYCQLGRTTDRTLRRRTYVPPGEIIRQIRAALKRGGRIDWITLSGSGEPTLHSEIGKIIREIKIMTDIPVAVLTSGALLHNASVRHALRAADLVIPDLDAGSARVFRTLNRPHRSLIFKKVVSGIKDFVSHFPGRVWLEVVLVKDVNDSPAELRRIRALAAKIRPSRVQLNTVVRPPGEVWVRPLSPREMQRARAFMAKCLRGIPIDVIAQSAGVGVRSPAEDIEERILSWLQRRPATARDLARGTGARMSDITRHITHLVETGRVREMTFRGAIYYIAL